MRISGNRRRKRKKRRKTELCVLQTATGVQWHDMNNDRKHSKRPQLINLETHLSERRRRRICSLWIRKINWKPLLFLLAENGWTSGERKIKIHPRNEKRRRYASPKWQVHVYDFNFMCAVFRCSAFSHFLWAKPNQPWARARVCFNRYLFHMSRATKCFVLSPTINCCSAEFRFFCQTSRYLVCAELRATIIFYLMDFLTTETWEKSEWVIKRKILRRMNTMNTEQCWAFASDFIFHATKPFPFRLIFTLRFIQFDILTRVNTAHTMQPFHIRKRIISVIRRGNGRQYIRSLCAFFELINSTKNPFSK